jgi:signal transduction histidine kinase
MSEIGFNQEVFIPFTLFLIFGGLLLYKFLSRSIFDEIFKSDKEIDDMVKKTLHELNTPVATIQMNNKLLSKNIQNDEMKWNSASRHKDIKRLKRIDEACNNLLKLYEHMEYEITSKIDKIELETFDIQDVIKNSISKFDDIKKDITIINNIQSLNITCDKYGFEIVCDNLISNAIKYNKENGNITISNQDNILSISDTGCGIDTENIFKIYDKYYQENIEQQGIGLGLNIVKEYCDKHKIGIKIDSRENEGTTFLLDLKGLISGKSN